MQLSHIKNNYLYLIHSYTSAKLTASASKKSLEKHMFNVKRRVKIKCMNKYIFKFIKKKMAIKKISMCFC